MILRVTLLLIAAAAGARAQDVRVVRADNQPVWGDSPRLVEELRIGSLDGDEAFLLERVAGIAITGNGDLWILDQQAARVRRYSPEGDHLGDVGRRGEGPGEFAMPLQVRRDPRDGTMLVWDPPNLRMHRFSDTGELVGSMPLELTGYRVRLGLPVMQIDTAGFTYALDRENSWTRRDPSGQVVEVLRPPPARPVGIMNPVRTWAAPSPRGFLVWGRNDEYAIHRPAPDGATLRIERRADRVPYEAAERAELQRLEDHFAARRDSDPSPIPVEKPVWSRFLVDHDGRIWIAMYESATHRAETSEERAERERFANPPRTWAQNLTFDVITDEGRFLGTVHFPSRTTTAPQRRLNCSTPRGAASGRSNGVPSTRST